MKKFIIILGSIMLGSYLFNLILSDKPESIKTSTKIVMQKLVENQKTTP